LLKYALLNFCTLRDSHTRTQKNKGEKERKSVGERLIDSSSKSQRKEREREREREGESAG
jgi:hypothetical protein